MRAETSIDFQHRHLLRSLLTSLNTLGHRRAALACAIIMTLPASAPRATAAVIHPDCAGLANLLSDSWARPGQIALALDLFHRNCTAPIAPAEPSSSPPH